MKATGSSVARLCLPRSIPRLDSISRALGADDADRRVDVGVRRVPGPRNARWREEKCLAGMNCPASRDDLVDHAAEHGADEPMLLALRAMPDRECEGPWGVCKEISEAS